MGKEMQDQEGKRKEGKREEKKREEGEREEGIKQSSLFDFLGNNSPSSETPSDKAGQVEFSSGETVQEKNKEELLQEWKAACLECEECSLHQQRSQAVFGVGSPRALMMLVGEAPGAEEDKQGLPFVGNAGQLLDNILKAIGLSREEVYITNVVKCRPPGNRLPQTREVKQCSVYWKKQLEIISPQIVICLGSLSAKTLIHPEARITKIRGEWRDIDSRWYLPTFHPAALLRDVKKKKPVWEDFQKVQAYYQELKKNFGNA